MEIVVDEAILIDVSVIIQVSSFYPNPQYSPSIEFIECFCLIWKDFVDYKVDIGDL